MEEYYMREALKDAEKAFELEEIPIGAIVVKDKKIISRGHNLREATKDPTAHAEIIAIRRASEILGGWRLTNCDMYVTIEPCPMCAGAILMARINRLFIGSMDPKGGAVGSLYNIVNDDRLNHKTEVVYNVLRDECSSIMKEFFKGLRKR